MFCDKYPNIKVSESFYWNFYRKNFNYNFGRPQVDVFCTCEALNNKIKSPHLNPVAKRVAVAELLVQKRKSKKCYTALKNQTSEVEPHVLSLAFDYMKPISLSKIPVQELYYMRQLSLNVWHP